MRDELLLDTHILVWFMSGEPGRLVPAVTRRIEQSIDAGACFVSPISAWEIALLESRGRLRLGASVDAWMAEARRPPGVRLAELSLEVLLESARLPDGFHADPADRMIVATARTGGMQLVTCDAQILAYGKAGHVRTIDGRVR